MEWPLSQGCVKILKIEAYDGCVMAHLACGTCVCRVTEGQGRGGAAIQRRSESSASRTFAARALIMNGFCRKWTPGARTP